MNIEIWAKAIPITSHPKFRSLATDEVTPRDDRRWYEGGFHNVNNLIAVVKSV